MEFPFYIASLALGEAAPFSAMATVSAMAKAMLRRANGSRMIASTSFEPDPGGFGEREKAESVSETTGTLRLASKRAWLGAFRRVGREADGKGGILLRRHGQHVLVDPGGRSDMLILHLQLAESIGHVAGDRIGARLAMR